MLFLSRLSFQYIESSKHIETKKSPSLINSDGVKARAPKAKTKAKAVVHKAKAKDKVINRDHAYVKTICSNQLGLFSACTMSKALK